MTNQVQTWYSKLILGKSGKLQHQIKFGTQLSIVKHLHYKLVVKFKDYVRSKPENAKEKITECFNKKIEVDPLKSLKKIKNPVQDYATFILLYIIKKVFDYMPNICVLCETLIFSLSVLCIHNLVLLSSLKLQSHFY